MFFEKIYISDVEEVFPDTLDSFIMCGGSNWDYYFLKKDKYAQSKELQNVNLLRFNSTDELKNYINNNDFIYSSLENRYFGVLCYG